MKHVFSFLLVALWLLAARKPAHASSLTLGWTASTSAAVAGYNVYYGTNSGNYPYMINVGSATSATITNLSPGVTYYFAATAYDAAGDQSAFSSQISFLVPGMLAMVPGANSGSPGSMQFSVAPAIPGIWYEIQASTNLITWTSLWQSSVVTTNGWMQFTDPAASLYPSRFYRLVPH